MNTTQLKRSYYNRIRDFDCVKREFRKWLTLGWKEELPDDQKVLLTILHDNLKHGNRKPNQNELKCQNSYGCSAVESAPRLSWARRVFAGRMPPIKRRFFAIRGFRDDSTFPNSIWMSNKGLLTPRTLGKSANMSKMIYIDKIIRKSNRNRIERQFLRSKA